MSFQRKIERNFVKKQWQKLNRGIRKVSRQHFAKLWEEYQDKKYGKSEHRIMVKNCNKSKK